jgi:hypothetical protein
MTAVGKSADAGKNNDKRLLRTRGKNAAASGIKAASGSPLPLRKRQTSRLWIASPQRDGEIRNEALAEVKSRVDKVLTAWFAMS